jgi:GTP-binding protein
VDLPGYGYARCSRTERDKWSRLIEAYLKKTDRLLAVTALIDAGCHPNAWTSNWCPGCAPGVCP